MRAFWELSTERQWGTILGPIPRSKVRDFGREAGFEGAMLDLFLTVVRAMDAGYLGWMGSEHERHVRMSKPPLGKPGAAPTRGRRARRK